MGSRPGRREGPRARRRGRREDQRQRDARRRARCSRARSTRAATPSRRPSRTAWASRTREAEALKRRPGDQTERVRAAVTSGGRRPRRPRSGSRSSTSRTSSTAAWTRCCSRAAARAWRGSPTTSPASSDRPTTSWDPTGDLPIAAGPGGRGRAARARRASWRSPWAWPPGFGGMSDMIQVNLLPPEYRRPGRHARRALRGDRRRASCWSWAPRAPTPTRTSSSSPRSARSQALREETLPQQGGAAGPLARRCSARSRSTSSAARRSRRSTATACSGRASSTSSSTSSRTARRRTPRGSTNSRSRPSSRRTAVPGALGGPVDGGQMRFAGFLAMEKANEGPAQNSAFYKALTGDPESDAADERVLRGLPLDHEPVARHRRPRTSPP